jgi:asparagine synthase (glutamine-hydrolysing)
MMVISEDGVRQSTYWSLGPEREIRMKSDAEYAEAFRSIFFDAVNCRLRSAFPLGTMLSGGLDSSSIACVAHELAGNRAGGNLHTFSVVFNQVKNSDERQFIEKIQASRKFKTHFITGDESTPFDDLERVLWFQDEPFYAPNLFLTRRVWQFASQNSVRVLLDGLFGDNVVSHGIEYLNELAGRGRWFPLARELRQLIEKSGSDMPLWKPLGRYIVQHGIRPRVPESGLSLWRRLRGMPADPVAHQCRVFRTEYSKRTGLRGRLERAYKHGRRIRSARHAHHDALNGGMVQTALEIYNKGCAEFGIETRFPFIDKRLVEYCLAIPGNQKIGQGYTRIILRRALRGVLPEEIRLRTGKGDLGWSFISGFNANREFVGTIIESSNLFLDRFFDVGFLKRIYGRCNSGKAAGDDLLTLFLVVVLSVWNARIAAH